MSMLENSRRIVVKVGTDKRIGKPEDVLAEGQEVQVKITDVDAENKRISLSIRALLVPAAEEAVEETEEAAE